MASLLVGLGVTVINAHRIGAVHARITMQSKDTKKLHQWLGGGGAGGPGG